MNTLEASIRNDTLVSIDMSDLLYFENTLVFRLLILVRSYLILDNSSFSEQDGKEGGKVAPAALRKREERLARLKDSGILANPNLQIYLVSLFLR